MGCLRQSGTRRGRGHQRIELGTNSRSSSVVLIYIKGVYKYRNTIIIADAKYTDRQFYIYKAKICLHVSNASRNMV